MQAADAFPVKNQENTSLLFSYGEAAFSHCCLSSKARQPHPHPSGKGHASGTAIGQQQPPAGRFPRREISIKYLPDSFREKHHGPAGAQTQHIQPGHPIHAPFGRRWVSAGSISGRSGQNGWGRQSRSGYRSPPPAGLSPAEGPPPGIPDNAAGTAMAIRQWSAGNSAGIPAGQYWRPGRSVPAPEDGCIPSRSIPASSAGAGRRCSGAGSPPLWAGYSRTISARTG